MYINTLSWFLENDEDVQENETMTESGDRKVTFCNTPTIYCYNPREPSPRHQRELLARRREYCRMQLHIPNLVNMEENEMVWS